MNENFKIVAAFGLGVTVGMVTVWGYLKKKYEAISQEEINSVKEVFKRNNNNNREENIENNNDLEVSQYIDLSEKYKEVGDYEEDKDDYMDKPYVISPDDFGEFEDYERISLTYYENDVLTDENDEVVDDIENIVGIESLNHFGDYEEVAVFVRNDRIKCDFEILKDNREYEMEEK